MFFIAVIPPHFTGRSDEGPCNNALPEARRRRGHQSQQAQMKRFFISDAVAVDVDGVFGELSAITCFYQFLVLFGAS